MVEQRSWPRLIVEALVIVFSILLALILDAAWEERSERVQEGELIERLADESRENRRSLEQVVSENRRSNAAALTLGSMDPESLRSISDDSLQTLIRGMSRAIFDPVQAESVSMIQSGDFRLIRSRDLRAALLGWTQAVVVAEEQVSYLLERIDERVEIFYSCRLLLSPHPRSGGFVKRIRRSEGCVDPAISGGTIPGEFAFAPPVPHPIS